MNVDKVPEELKHLPQWVCAWNTSKTPMQATQKKAANVSDPSTWSTFEVARNAVKSGMYDYVGFVFADNGIIGVDLDFGFDDLGLLQSESACIIAKCHSYTEKSRSKKGIHILMKGDLPFKGRNNRKGMEIYKSNRYFILTGDVLIFPTMIDNQQAINDLVETYFKEELKEGENTPSPRFYSPVWEKPHDGKVNIRPTYPTVPEGCRNVSLTSLAGQLHSTGYTQGEIFRELLHCNSVACIPPLDRSEITTIVRSVTRYRRK